MAEKSYAQEFILPTIVSAVVAACVWTLFFLNKPEPKYCPCPSEYYLLNIYPIEIKGVVAYSGPSKIEGRHRSTTIYWVDFQGDTIKEKYFGGYDWLTSYVDVGDSIFKDQYEFSVKVKKPGLTQFSKKKRIKVFPLECFSDPEYWKLREKDNTSI